MYSYITKENEVLDWKFKKFQYGYTFYVGDILLGQLFKPRHASLGWDAVSWSNHGNMVNGFISRHKAAEYLIGIYSKQIKDPHATSRK